jgi:hypothetical protein
MMFKLPRDAAAVSDRCGQVWKVDGVTHLILSSVHLDDLGCTIHRALTLDDEQHYAGRSAPDNMKLFEFEESIWEGFINWERLA